MLFSLRNEGKLDGYGMWQVWPTGGCIQVLDGER